MDPVAFYYDLASPDAYLAAERVVGVLGTVPEFVPVRIGGVGAFRCAEEESIYRADVERRAAEYGLMPVRWPAEVPADTEWAMLVATYAKQTGRVVAYSMAAFRQAFAAGRDLGERDWVLVAAAGCISAAARDAGVLDVPAVRVCERVFHGDRELGAAARALYRSEGFVEEGVLRDALLSGDRFESLVVMSLLRPEWTP